MPKRRTDIYYEAHARIMRQFPGRKLWELAHLYLLPQERWGEVLNELRTIESDLAEKYQVARSTVISQTSEIIRKIRTNQKES